MKNLIQKNWKSSTAFDDQGILFKKLNTLTSSIYHRVEYFLLKFFTRFQLSNVYKMVLGIFFNTINFFNNFFNNILKIFSR